MEDRQIVKHYQKKEEGVDYSIGKNLALYLFKLEIISSRCDNSAFYKNIISREELNLLKRLNLHNNKNNYFLFSRRLNSKISFEDYKNLLDIKLPTMVDSIEFDFEKICLDLSRKISPLLIRNKSKKFGYDFHYNKHENYVSEKSGTVVNPENKDILMYVENGLRLNFRKNSLNCFELVASLLFPNYKKLPLKIPRVELPHLFVIENNWSCLDDLIDNQG